MKFNDQFQCDTKQFQFAGVHGMQIERIYRDVVLVGTSAILLLVNGAILPDDVQGPPPPPGHPLGLHFVHGGLCTTQVEHIDRFHPSYYQFKCTRLCRA